MLSDAEIVIGGNDKFERVSADLRRELLLAGEALPAAALDALKLGQPEAFNKLFQAVDRHKQILPSTSAAIGPGIGQVIATFTALRKELAQASRDKFDNLRNDWSRLLDSLGEDGLKEAISALLDPIPLDQGKTVVKSGPALLKKLAALYTGKDVQTDKLGGQSQPVKRLRVLQDNPSAWTTTPDQQALATFLLEAFEFDQAGLGEEQIDQASIRAAVAHVLQARLAQMDLAELHLDELIELVLERLQPADSRAAMDLREGIQATYPVCLVDDSRTPTRRSSPCSRAIYGVRRSKPAKSASS